MKKIIITVSITFLVVSLWLIISYQNALDNKLNIEADKISYSIESGTSLSAVVYDLANKNILKHPKHLLWYARLNGLSNKMKTGDYQLSSNLSAREFLDKIFTGKVIQYSLTIIEGWSFNQLLEAISHHPEIKQTFSNLSKEEIMDKLGLNGVHYEGRFLPDTYHFPKHLTDLEFLKRAYYAMETVLEEEWKNRIDGLPYKTPYEALIMASIVEKETGLASERELISGVFFRRLNKRMRLQTDPTVIYGMGDKYKGNIRKRDLLRDTPYNTYRRGGLPPTPIAMPGRKAIYAALHPAAGDVLFFVSRGDGSHVFSATVTEHNRAVCKYQKKGRNCNY